MFQDLQITSNDNIFQYGAVWNIDFMTVGANDDDSTPQSDIFT